MKLIDLDDLRKYCWEYPCDIESITIELRNIPQLLSTFPTIEAIPILWIEEYIKNNIDDEFISLKGLFHKMIIDWRKENEK